MASRVRSLQLAPDRPAVVLIARPLAQPAQDLPLLAAAAAAAGRRDRRVPERGRGVAVRQAARGRRSACRIGREPGSRSDVRVLGVWRDYARQFGAIAIDAAAYRALTGDERINDLALWFAPGADALQVQQRLRTLGGETGLLEFAATPELRKLSLAIFDRSFAVTYYLQAVAIAIGLVGIAASMSAQVLARRKEFGLLSHLGLTRAQIIGVVAGEGAAWLAAGALIGLALGLAVSVVLVHVVNPQSFHWTMQLLLPWGELLALCAAVLAGRHRHRGLQRARCRLARRAAVGEGGLVMRRRDGLAAALLALGLRSASGPCRRRRRRRCAAADALHFPRDHGAHLGAAIEWWYITGDAARARRSAPRLPDHLLPQPHRPGRRSWTAASRRGICCLRMPR